MYARMTDSMKTAISETDRRRKRQEAYNKRHNITPATIVKAVPEGETRLDEVKNMSKHDLGQMEITLEAQMAGYAHDLDFERAIECRDRIKSIQREIKYKNEK